MFSFNYQPVVIFFFPLFSIHTLKFTLLSFAQPLAVLSSLTGNLIRRGFVTSFFQIPDCYQQFISIFLSTFVLTQKWSKKSRANPVYRQAGIFSIPHDAHVRQLKANAQVWKSRIGKDFKSNSYLQKL